MNIKKIISTINKIVFAIFNFTANLFTFCLIIFSIFITILFAHKISLVNDENSYGTIPNKNNNEEVSNNPISINTDVESKDIRLFIDNPKIIPEGQNINDFDYDKDLYFATSINIGDTIVYKLYYEGDIKTFNLTEGHIGLRDFTAKNMELRRVSDKNEYYLILSYITAPYSTDMLYITINGGTAISSTGEMVNGAVNQGIKIYSNFLTRLTLWLLPKDGQDIFKVLVSWFGTTLTAINQVKLKQNITSPTKISKITKLK